MTREEYVDFANALKNNYTIDFDKLPEFCDMAISIFPALESANLISREDVKAKYKEQIMSNLIDKERNIDFSEYAEIHCKRFNEFIDSIPCAVSEREKGKWIYCGNSEINGLKICECTKYHKRNYGSHNFCPNCGADI